MSHIITVDLNAKDEFVLTDPDSGKVVIVPSIQIHAPEFIVDSSVKTFFLKSFPGKNNWECTQNAMNRIDAITDFNCLEDNWPGADV